MRPPALETALAERHRAEAIFHDHPAAGQAFLEQARRRRLTIASVK